MSKLAPTIVLASASPRRRELLAQIGVPHVVLAVDMDESPLPDEAPAALAARLARSKAIAGRARDGGTRAALGAEARIEQRDIRSAGFSPCSALVILDVLLYLEVDEQRRVLERAVRALEPDGVLIVREADAAAGLSFRVTVWSERLMEAVRGRLRPRLHYRRAADWIGLMEGLGMKV